MANQTNIDFFAAIVKLYPDVPTMLDYNAWEDVMNEQYGLRKDKIVKYAEWLNKEGAAWFVKEYLGKPEVPKELKNITANTTSVNPKTGMSTGKKVAIVVVAAVVIAGVILAVKYFKNKQVKK